MKTTSKISACKSVRVWLSTLLGSKLSVNADWVQRHVANCPRCQRRLAGFGRVDLAIELLKAQPQRLDLLMRANAQAIGILKHQLRHAPQAIKLRQAVVDISLWQRITRYAGAGVNVAACLSILLLMRVGIFGAISTFEQKSEAAVNSYYAEKFNEAGQIQ